MIYFLFILGFFTLIKGADILVLGASSIAKRLHISDLIIGLTIVSFGTSAPELIVNIMAQLKGNGWAIAVGNVLGSNMANITLILGITALITPLTIKRLTLVRDIPYSMFGILLLIIFSTWFFGPSLSAWEWGFLLAGMIFFILLLLLKKEKPDDITSAVKWEKQLSITRSILYIILWLLGLKYGGEWIVNGAVYISEILGMSKGLISTTIIAIGTSLPELATSIIAIKKDKTDIIIGNAIGSNIFNIFWILGLSSIIAPLPITYEHWIDLGLTFFFSGLMILFASLHSKKIFSRNAGIFFLLGYLGYLIYVIVRG